MLAIPFRVVDSYRPHEYWHVALSGDAYNTHYVKLVTTNL